MGHLCGAVAGLLVGIVMLENRKVKIKNNTKLPALMVHNHYHQNQVDKMAQRCQNMTNTSCEYVADYLDSSINQLKDGHEWT